VASRIRVALYSPWAVYFQAPLYRRIAADPRIDFTAIFGSDIGVHRPLSKYGPDVRFREPVLEGYDSIFLRAAASNGWSAGLAPPDWDIATLVRRGRFDVLWLNGYNSSTHLLAATTQLALGKPILVREEQTLIPHRALWRKVAKNIGLRILLWHAYGLFIGTENRRWFRHWGVPEERLFFTPYAVDNERLQAEADTLARRRHELREEFGLRANRPVILSVARFVPEKQPEFLIEAFRRLRVDRDASLLLVGSGPLEADARRLVARRGIPDVMFAGFLDHEEIGRAYEVADIFVLPSREDTWGLVVNEAMNFGLPVVATDGVGCATDLIVEGRNGFVVPRDDPDLLANRLRLLVDSQELRLAMGSASRDRIASWNYDKAADGVLEAVRAAAWGPKDGVGAAA
jgi:glycosyltransferase involved in cell wall biosynthesis